MKSLFQPTGSKRPHRARRYRASLLHPLRTFGLIVLLLFTLTASAAAQGSFFYPFSPSALQHDLPAVIGSSTTYTIRKKDTLLDIARDFDLGFNEVRRLYPELDTWMPAAGMDITIPRMWILPDFIPNQERSEVVINLAEMRLFLFDYKHELIRSYPVGIGHADTPTPTGSFLIREKVVNPIWTIPEELRGKYQVSQIPAGKNNPLGESWLGLGDSDYGIHGTNLAWSVGRTSTNGCIRLYPEDISRAFRLLDYETRVSIVYQPVKFGWKNGELLVEVHPDVYDRIEDLAAYAYRLLQKKDLLDEADMNKLRVALERQSGEPGSIARTHRAARK